MKGFRSSVLALCFHLALLTCSAQQPTQGQAPVATATVPPQTPTEEIRSTVAFIQVMYKHGPNVERAIGTGFFVSVSDKRLGENRVFTYVVTNRHVAQPGIDLGTPYPVLEATIRLNLVAPRGEIESVQERIPLGDQLHWYFPQDDAVDLAVLPFGGDPKIYSLVYIPSSLIATSAQVNAGDVVVGDHVIFAGYFSSFPGQNRIQPIVRQGVIAMLPDEDLDTTLHKPGRIYLADLHAFHGNSGSPVFVDTGGTPHHGGIMIGSNYRLLGLISGYYPESAGYSVPAATVLTGEVKDNSGIATIVPADELRKLLDSPEIHAAQDKIISVLPTR